MRLYQRGSGEIAATADPRSKREDLLADEKSR